MASSGQIKKFLKYDQSVTSNVREPTRLDGLRSLPHLIGRFMEFPTEKRQLTSFPTRYTLRSPGLSAQTPGSAFTRLIGHVMAPNRFQQTLPPQAAASSLLPACPAFRGHSSHWALPGSRATEWMESLRLTQKQFLQTAAPGAGLRGEHLLQQHLACPRQGGSPQTETQQTSRKRCQQICTFQKQSVFRSRNRKTPKNAVDSISKMGRRPEMFRSLVSGLLGLTRPPAARGALEPPHLSGRPPQLPARPAQARGLISSAASGLRPQRRRGQIPAAQGPHL